MQIDLLGIPCFERMVAEYVNTEANNDFVHRKFSELTEQNDVLRVHRRYVEQNDLGFGDAAFHAMWLGLLDCARRRFGKINALEIGVFKGQIISLWALIAKHWNMNISITAISPLCGQPAPRWAALSSIRSVIDKRFREKVKNGNFYPDSNYEEAIRSLFEQFELKSSEVRFCRGYSSDTAILQSLSSDRFHIVYVDGDHTYQGALDDFENFGEKVLPGGWLIADDAGCNLPGTTFWKGHEAVSRAANELPRLGFRNVLNVGHNRIYERVL